MQNGTRVVIRNHGKRTNEVVTGTIVETHAPWTDVNLGGGHDVVKVLLDEVRTIKVRVNEPAGPENCQTLPARVVSVRSGDVEEIEDE